MGDRPFFVPGDSVKLVRCWYVRGNVLAESGNQVFTVYVGDMDEPGAGTDMFWFTARLTLAGEIPFSLDSP